MVRMIQPKVRRMEARTARPAPKQADPELLTPEHRTWRANVLRLAGHRCQATDKGKRCTVSAPARLFADHIVERRDGGDPLDVRNGQCLCGKHHTLKTAQARAVRLAQRA
ncbi:HNH endonuclease [Mesorhizobium sp. YM1C-6-2]|nr:HNH endonuclease [Mesorhizobium sp. YM1C-6-2]